MYRIWKNVFACNAFGPLRDRGPLGVFSGAWHGDAGRGLFASWFGLVSSCRYLIRLLSREFGGFGFFVVFLEAFLSFLLVLASFCRCGWFAKAYSTWLVDVDRLYMKDGCFKSVFLVMTCRGPLFWLQKHVYEKMSPSAAFYDLSKHFPDEFHEVCSTLESERTRMWCYMLWHDNTYKHAEFHSTLCLSLSISKYRYGDSQNAQVKVSRWSFTKQWLTSPWQHTVYVQVKVTFQLMKDFPAPHCRCSKVHKELLEIHL